MTLDEVVTREAIERIDLLKVDVEGAEADVLAGGHTTLASGAVAAVLFEVSTPQTEALGHEPGAAFEELHAARYIVHELEQDGSLGRVVGGPRGVYANYVAVRA
jgi:hypothetical protein